MLQHTQPHGEHGHAHAHGPHAHDAADQAQALAHFLEAHFGASRVEAAGAHIVVDGVVLVTHEGGRWTVQCGSSEAEHVKLHAQVAALVDRLVQRWLVTPLEASVQ